MYCFCFILCLVYTGSTCYPLYPPLSQEPENLCCISLIFTHAGLTKTVYYICAAIWIHWIMDHCTTVEFLLLASEAENVAM